MKYDPDKHHRRSIRLKGYDYSQPGAYFVTICTHNHELLLNDLWAISMIQKWWDALPEKFPNVRIDQFVIIPNHIHGIIFIVDNPVGADLCVRPKGQSHRIAPTLDEHIGSQSPNGPTLGKIVQWFKTMSANEYLRAIKANGSEIVSGKLWQRNFYEHVIRSESELNDIREYVLNNPIHWEEDENHPRILQNETVGADPCVRPRGQSHRIAPAKGI